MPCGFGGTDLAQINDSPVTKLPGKVAKLMAAVAVRCGVHARKSGIASHGIKEFWPGCLQAQDALPTHLVIDVAAMSRTSHPEQVWNVTLHVVSLLASGLGDT